MSSQRSSPRFGERDKERVPVILLENESLFLHFRPTVDDGEPKLLGHSDHIERQTERETERDRERESARELLNENNQVKNTLG